MDQGYWILDDDRRPVKVSDVLTWGRWYERDEARNVGDEVINDARISTKFLGIDHRWSEGPPVLFETMIFGGEHDGYQERCSTWKQAEAEHEKACALVRGQSAN